MIDDFGKKIEGAAKDRWGTYLAQMGYVSDDDLAYYPLSRTFPEPNYKALLNEGGDSWVLSFVRAAREACSPKPRDYEALEAWIHRTRVIRDLCAELLEGNISAARVRQKVEDTPHLRNTLKGKIALYERFGHDRSLKGYKVSRERYTRIGEQRFDPPVARWTIKNARAGVQILRPTLEEALDAFAPTTPKKAATQMKFSLYSYRDPARTGVWIGKKFGRETVDLERFESKDEAVRYLRDHHDALVRKVEALKVMPAERGVDNRGRRGIDHRQGEDVTPEMFSEAFGFRGVQFGNQIGQKRRQRDLNDTYDALMDLAHVLDVPPTTLSLHGTLGMAFGARGRGGRGGVMAHYEPQHVVINLTKKRGAGSLAHEWFHALDNYIARTAGYPSDYATFREGLYFDAYPFWCMTNDMIDQTGVGRRSEHADRVRSAPYFSLREEIGARCFEAWVVDILARQGMHNDYLSNIADEEVFEAEARLLGLPEDEERYPYPKASEMEQVRASFATLLANDRPLYELLVPWRLRSPKPEVDDVDLSKYMSVEEIEF